MRFWGVSHRANTLHRFWMAFQPFKRNMKFSHFIRSNILCKSMNIEQWKPCMAHKAIVHRAGSISEMVWHSCVKSWMAYRKSNMQLDKSQHFRFPINQSYQFICYESNQFPCYAHTPIHPRRHIHLVCFYRFIPRAHSSTNVFSELYAVAVPL